MSDPLIDENTELRSALLEVMDKSTVLAREVERLTATLKANGICPECGGPVCNQTGFNCRTEALEVLDE